jgi:hypothetical protein
VRNPTRRESVIGVLPTALATHDTETVYIACLPRPFGHQRLTLAAGRVTVTEAFPAGSAVAMITGELAPGQEPDTVRVPLAGAGVLKCTVVSTYLQRDKP